MKKAETISLQGKDYAKVAERIRVFREECPRGSITTEPKMDGQMVLFKATVVKDRSRDTSAVATGHAIGENKGQKAFEKIESIAVGRALAMLGYLASGEIASGEEMEEFISYKEERQQEDLLEFQAQVAEIETIEELREFYKKTKGKGKEHDAIIMNKSKLLTETK